MDKRTKSRWQLLFVAGLFAAPFLVALVLNLAGWQPRGTRNFGELLTPPQDLKAIHVQLADGSAFAWQDQRWQWTLLALGGSSCEQACLAQLDLLHRARLTLNQNADRVRIVYAGPALPAAVLEQLRPISVLDERSEALAALRPQTSDALGAALVDPNGFEMLRYSAGFDANGLKKDLARLIH